MQKDEQKTVNKKITINSYIKYSSISFQMLAIILIMAFGGRGLDDFLNFDKPIFTAILSIVGVGIALYLVIKKMAK